MMRPPAEQASVEAEVMAEGWRPMLEELQVEDEAELAAVVQLMMPCGDGHRRCRRCLVSDQGLRSGLTAPGGVLWLLYSVVASRGVERTREDLRSRAGLIGVDGCCDHAVINLLLFGRCFEHVDQDSMLNLNAGPSRVGVLINEPKIALADCLLTPLTPVWVMLCGGHYTVLWSDDDGVLAAGHTTAANGFADIAAAARVEEAAPDAAAGDLDDLDRAIVMSLEGELDEPLPPLPPSARTGTAEAGGGKRPPHNTRHSQHGADRDQKVAGEPGERPAGAQSGGCTLVATGSEQQLVR